MLHPALSRALATAHIEDLHRAAPPRQTVRLQQGALIRLRQGALIRLQGGSAGLRRICGGFSKWSQPESNR